MSKMFQFLLSVVILSVVSIFVQAARSWGDFTGKLSIPVGMSESLCGARQVSFTTGPAGDAAGCVWRHTLISF